MTRSRAWAPPVLAILLLPLCACSTIPDVDGVRADELPPQAVFDAAARAMAEQDAGRAAELAEYVLRTAYDFSAAEDLRFLAAEARFQQGDYRRALPLYRRLMEEFPRTTRDDVVARRAFTIGKELLERPRTWFGDFDRMRDVGIESLTFLVTRFPRHDRADDGWKELAEAFLDDGQYQAAADVFERLVREYPDSEWIDLALFQVADAYRRQTRGDAFDADPLLRAHAALGRYLARYPDGNFVAQAEREMRELEEQISRRELEIADFYGYRGAFSGARVHRANAALRFPDTETAAQAREDGTEVDEALENSTDALQPRADRPRWRRAPVSGPRQGSAPAGAAPR